MATRQELFAEIAQAGGIATEGVVKPYSGISLVVVNIGGPVVNGAREFYQTHLVVTAYGEAGEEAVWRNEKPKILQPVTAVTPVGSNAEILQAIGAIFSLTGKRVIAKRIVHTADGAEVSARVATLASNTYEELNWVVVLDNGQLKAFARSGS